MRPAARAFLVGAAAVCACAFGTAAGAADPDIKTMEPRSVADAGIALPSAAGSDSAGKHSAHKDPSKKMPDKPAHVSPDIRHAGAHVPQPHPAEGVPVPVYADANGDGILDDAEEEAWEAAGGPGRDADHDGRLSIEEQARGASPYGG